MCSFVAGAAAASLVLWGVADASSGASPKRLVGVGRNGELVYGADAQGNCIPDFSHCGYMGGGVAIPDAPVKRTLAPVSGTGDDTARIQAEIDAVAALPPDEKTGLRGAVLLKRGVYRVSGTLRIAASGVVLRGEGQHLQGTLLAATGTDKRSLIVVQGPSGPRDAGGKHDKVVDAYVPVGARSFALESTDGLKVGDGVFVRRHGNAKWIHEIGMDRIESRPEYPASTKQWEPFSLDFERVITAIDGPRVTVDVPIVCAIEAQWGGGEVFVHNGGDRIEQVGIEHLRCHSQFNERVTDSDGGPTYPADEDHCETLISMDNVANAWVRNVTAKYLSHACVNLGRGCTFVTAQDSACLAMVSKLTGGRRSVFSIAGQMCLVQRCYTSTARHGFAVDSRVCGPNAFVDCLAADEHGSSEPHHCWSVGGLFDNVRADIAIQDRQYWGSGHGWAGANYVVWNCEGKLVCQKPPTAQNYAIGFVGTKDGGAWPRPDGHWESTGRHVQPRSLYYTQLRNRLGLKAVQQVAAPAQFRGPIYTILAGTLSK
ncbi:MAG: hypothetical protein AMK72_07275 [Planctomycetes bacterium SM23_25]|nr:MAG: hypothetical protein AMK72_07275 [Planctomycetes bacterium SM23_25]